MAFKMPSRVKETTVTSGTGTYALAGPVSSFRAFSAGLINGDTTHYYVEGGSDYEYGSGTYSANTLARTTIFKSSNSNVAVNWPAGTKTIGISEIGPSDLDATNIGLMNSLMEMPTGWRNLIINGDFAIDQRNAGGATSSSAGIAAYPADRWVIMAGQAPGVLFTQRQGDPDFLGDFLVAVQPTTIDASLAVGDVYYIDYRIEGYLSRDCNWGNANAKTITISFDVKGSSAMTLPLSVHNASLARSWLGSFGVTTGWTRVSLSVPGDTTGTWLTNNGIGILLQIALGVGTTYQGVAGWQAGNLLTLAGMTNFMASLSNVLYIKNVQFELGGVATEFERVAYDEQLARCQRYYEKTFPMGTAPADNATILGAINFGQQVATGLWGDTWTFAVTKRATPTIATFSPQGGTAGYWRDGPNTTSSQPFISASDTKVKLYTANGASYAGTATNWMIHATASAEL